MHNLIRTVHRLGLYLLPTSLLLLSGVLATALFQTPTPTAPPANMSASAESSTWQADAELLLLLTEALYHSQATDQFRAQTLVYAPPVPVGRFAPPVSIRL